MKIYALDSLSKDRRLLTAFLNVFTHISISPLSLLEHTFLIVNYKVASLWSVLRNNFLLMVYIGMQGVTSGC